MASKTISLTSYVKADSRLYATASLTVTQGTQSVSGNYTDVTFTVSGAQVSPSTFMFTGTTRNPAGTVVVTINGSTAKSLSIALTSYGQGTCSGSGTVRVPHNADGTKTVSFSLAMQEVTGNFSGDTWKYGATSNSGTLALTTIPRESSISSISNDSMTINGTNALTVNIARASSSFTHTVKFTFGDYTETLTSQGTSAKLIVPLSWIGRFGSGGNGSLKGSVSVQTYNGSTAIGSAVSKEFTLTCPAASSISSLTSSITVNGSDKVTASISRAVSSFLHKVVITFGSHTDTTNSVATSKEFTMPLSWIDTFGNGVSGSKTAKVTVTTFYGNQQIGSAVSKDFTVKCPVASSISWNTANIVCDGTNTIGVSIVPSVASFTHTVKWAFGSYTNTATGVGKSTSYAPPTTWLNAIQNANSGTGSVYVTTFYGTQQIGSVVSKNFTMSVPSYSPNFSSVTTSAVQPTSISSWDIYVQNYSKVKFTFNGVAGVYGSQIKNYAVTINGVSYNATSNAITSKTLTSDGSLSYTATVTDSRGKTATKTGTISVQTLVKPTFSSATISRYNGTTVDDEGTQVYFKFSYTFGSYGDLNSCTNEVYYKVSTASSYTKYGTFTNGTALVISNVVFDISKSYDFRVVVTDKLGNAIQYNYTVGTAKGLIDVDGINNSIGLLKMTSKKGTVEVGGVLEVDEQSRLFGGSYNHSFLSNAGGNYIKFATVTITQNYADNSISFDMTGRSWKQKVSVSMYFSGGATNDPTLSYIGVSGKDVKIYGVKTATSTWDLYCYDSWGYERYTIYNLASYITLNQLNNQVLKYYEIDWHNTPVATLPSGAVASENTYYYDGTYHVFNKSIYYPVNGSLRRCVPSDNMTHVRMVDGTKKYLEVASSIGTFGIDAWVSDVALKDNITETDVDNALEIIDNLRHVQFDWKSNYEHVEIGYIADELEDLFSQLVFEVPQYDEEGNPTGETVKQIYNTTMIPLITKAMQELKHIVDTSGGGGDSLPIGSVVEWDGDVVPTNWLLLDGQEVSREEYSELFELYGTRYGEGDGITTFNLPNRCGKVAVGYDGTDSDFNTLGNTGGEKAHTLTTSEMPSHTHTQNAHSHVQHNYTWYNHSGKVDGKIPTSGTFNAEASNGSNFSTNSTTATNKNTGGGQAHNNLQPYIVVNFIVKAKQSKAILQSGTIIDNLNSDDSTMALSARMGKLLNEKINNVSGGGSSSSLSFEHDGNGNVTINFS